MRAGVFLLDTFLPFSLAFGENTGVDGFLFGSWGFGCQCFSGFDVGFVKLGGVCGPVPAGSCHRNVGGTEAVGDVDLACPAPDVCEGGDAESTGRACDELWCGRFGSLQPFLYELVC